MLRRLIISLAAAAFVAACSDVPSAPTSSLQPRSALLDLEGDPPPPPVSGDGRAEFDVFAADDAETACTAHDSFTFSYNYFRNAPDNNAVLHMSAGDRGLDISIHETDRKIDAKGTVNGPGFTFEIADVVGGSVTSKESHVPSSVTVQLTGKLTTAEGVTCTANAVLTARLVDVEQPG